MPDAPGRAALTALKLWNFRNYEALRLDLDARPVVLFGPNGAGKTNLLEAVSFLAPGRGLRRAMLAEVARAASDGAYERALRHRNRLLEDGADAALLDAVEAQVAEIGTAIAAARREAVARLRALIAEGADPGPFPTAEVRLEGTVEDLLGAGSAVEAEDRYRALLRASRARDRAAGRTLEGPHRNDLAVAHAEKGMPAERASTGEQKALLIGLVLAEARLVTKLTGTTPVLLLDEVAAHLDAQRRAALYGTLIGLGAQAWLTGTDAAAFTPLDGRAQRFLVQERRVAPA